MNENITNDTTSARRENIVENCCKLTEGKAVVEECSQNYLRLKGVDKLS